MLIPTLILFLSFNVAYAEEHTSQTKSDVPAPVSQNDYLAENLASQFRRMDELVGVDVVLLIDVSGSMATVDAIIEQELTGIPQELSRIEGAKKAATDFTGFVSPTDQIGVVSFGDDAYNIQSLTTDVALVRSKIEMLSSLDEGTNISDALNTGSDELSLNSIPSHAPALILLSDGTATEGETNNDRLAEIAENAKQIGIRIFTIGLGVDDPNAPDGTQVDLDALETIASSPDDFYYAPTIDDLEEIYRKIARSIRPSPQGNLRLSIADAFRNGSQVTANVTVFNPGSTSQEYELYVKLSDGFETLQEYTTPILVSWGGSNNQTYDFGILEQPRLDYYGLYISLSDSEGNLLESIPTRIAVGDELAQAEDAADRLKKAATDEIGQIEDMLSEDMETSLGQLVGESASLLYSLWSDTLNFDLVSSDDLPVTGQAWNAVWEELLGLLSSYVDVADLVANVGEEERIELTREYLVHPPLNRYLISINGQHNQFTEQIQDTGFDWSRSWNNDIRLSEYYIRSRVEDDRSAYGLDISFQWEWPPISSQQATLQDMNNDFDWFTSGDGATYLEYMDYFLIAVLVVLAGIVIFGTGGLGLTVFLKASAIISKIQVAKSVLVIAFLSAFSILYFYSGIYPVAQSVEDGYSDGITTLWNRISGSTNTRRHSGFTAPTISHDRNTVTVAKNSAQDVWLYTPDGYIITRLGDETSEFSAKLPYGQYEIVSFNNSQDFVYGEKQSVNINIPDNVTLQVNVDSPIRPSDLSYTADIVVTNTSDQPTGSLYLTANTSLWEVFEVWEIELDVGESETITHTFDVNGSGSHTYQVRVGDDMVVLSEQSVGLVVGEASNFVINPETETEYESTEAIELSFPITNIGNLAGQAQLEVVVLDTRNPDHPYVEQTQQLELAVGASESISVDLSEVSEPGTYEVYFYINGSLYGTRKFTRVADGVLYVVPAEFGRAIDGSSLTYEFSLLDNAMMSTDAVVTATITSPSGLTTTVGAEQIEEGVYSFDTSIDKDGTHTIDLTVVKDGWRIVNYSDYVVKNSPSFIYTSIIGELADNRLRPLQITIEDENKNPIPDVTVTISSTNGIQMGVSDANGIVDIALDPGNTSVDVTLEKLGYATTRYTLETIGSVTGADFWMQEGWNLVSFSQLPDERSIDDLISAIRTDVDVILSYDGEAQSYYPSIPSDLNTLTQFSTDKGYWIKLNRSLVWTVDGVLVDETSPIALQSGWNLVSYLPRTALNIENALVSIEGKYEIVRGWEGEALTHAPELTSTLSTLRAMKPRMGYWIKMNEPASLIYPDTSQVVPSTSGETSQITLPASNVYADDSQSSPTNQWIDLYALDVEWNGTPLNKGSRVTIYDSDGVIAGEGTVRETGVIGFIPVYADDPSTPVDEGAEVGDELTVFINGFEVELFGELTWEADGSLVEIPLSEPEPDPTPLMNFFFLPFLTDNK